MLISLKAEKPFSSRVYILLCSSNHQLPNACSVLSGQERQALAFGVQSCGETGTKNTNIQLCCDKGHEGKSGLQ